MLCIAILVMRESSNHGRDCKSDRYMRYIQHTHSRTSTGLLVNDTTRCHDRPNSLHEGYCCDSELKDPIFAGAGTFLTIYRLYGSLRDVSNAYESIWPRLSHVKHFTPVLWAFYLDGTLFFIPHGNYTWDPRKPSYPVNCRKLELVTRLLLNLHEASKGIKDSVVTQQLSTLRFGDFRNGQDQTANSDMDERQESDIDESAAI
ncbi:hypothetical protein D9756_008056 [Leucocoprinus leucothites]|uniref:Uncharacterized protein n=1 Tax=Leucocoprinus leucothites TaxID=201217 RepID=A0A8H5D6N2_9AGAR|nr:hypothetical protein D9756_008056 [Leucoagaricus leucothites]